MRHEKFLKSKFSLFFFIKKAANIWNLFFVAVPCEQINTTMLFLNDIQEPKQVHDGVGYGCASGMCVNAL